MAKYYGQKEVKDIIADGESKSFVVFTDDTQISLANVIIADAVTAEPTDATKLRSLRCFPVVAEVLKVLHSCNVQINEIDFITQRVIISINKSCEMAEAIMWGKPQEEQTMEDINQVLMTKKEDTAGVPSPFHPEPKE